MANVLYDKARESFLKGELAAASDTWKVVLVDAASYTPDLVNHQFLSDIPSGARTAITVALSGKTTASGVFDAADATFTAVSGAQSEYLVIYQDTGSAATSRLIAFIDTATGLPITPNGADETVVWDNGANKIFKL